ncbi:MAG: hypothetical protein IPK64_17355 [bacterium]|nr:hypothetical protein [bacterium]
MPNCARNRSRWFTTTTLAVAMPALVLAAAGCLGEPPLDERWTLLEFTDSTPGAQSTVPADRPVAVSVRGRITYRAIRTGFIVAELRYSDTLAPAMVSLDPQETTLESARTVEYILANSVSAGRATRAVTGFDHLVQDLDLAFTAPMPAGLTAAAGDSASLRSLFLVLYLGEGEEVELAAGRDSLVVTPFGVEDAQVLFTGYPLRVVPTAGSPAS